MTERENLLRQCEERPEDRTLLLVTADWMAERGDPEWERVLRWMERWQKWPTRLTTGSWLWTCFGGIHEGLPHSALPRVLCTRLGFWEWRCWSSWQEAVQDLATALSLGEVDCHGDPHKVRPGDPGGH